MHYLNEIVGTFALLNNRNKEKYCNNKNVLKCNNQFNHKDATAKKRQGSVAHEVSYLVSAIKTLRLLSEVWSTILLHKQMLNFFHSHVLVIAIVE